MIFVSDAGTHPHESPAVADRCTGEVLRVARLAREVGRFEERGLRDVGVAAPALRVTEREEQLGAFGVVRVRPSEAWSAIAKSRAPSSNASCCTARSPASRAYLTARSTGPTGRLAQQCRASSASRGPRSPSAQHLERASGFVVEAASPQRRDLLVQRLGHDCVPEAQMTCSPRAVHDHRDRRRFVERGDDIDVVPRERVQDVEREVAPEHRRELEHALALVRQLAQSTQHRLAHVARDEQPIRLGRVVEPSFGREEPRGFADVQRVAIGELADPRGQPQRRARRRLPLR